MLYICNYKDKNIRGTCGGCYHKKPHKLLGEELCIDKIDNTCEDESYCIPVEDEGGQMRLF